MFSLIKTGKPKGKTTIDEDLGITAYVLCSKSFGFVISNCGYKYIIPKVFFHGTFAFGVIQALAALTLICAGDIGAE